MGKFCCWYVEEAEDWHCGGEEVVIDSGARGWVGGFILLCSVVVKLIDVFGESQ